MRYVHALRIEKARQLLADPRHSVTEVALDCGFSHAQHFSTSFRKAVGVAPSVFRRALHDS